LKDVLLSGGGETRGEWALDVIIDGLAGGRLQPATSAAPHPNQQRGRGGKNNSLPAA
jgi:hypothetical protein